MLLDLLVCSATLHKRVRNCHTTLDGLDSNHHDVALSLNITSIKYKAHSKLHSGDIDWRKICEEDEQCKLCNKYLLELTSCDMSYNNLCKAVVRAGKETAIAIGRKCEGWYTASKDILAPAIQEKNCLRHRLHDSGSLDPNEIAAIKMPLKVVNKRNHDLVEMAKAKWYKGVCSKIHEMNMDPRLAWENIRILTGGKTSHHKRVCGMHFSKVLNNHRPVDCSILDLLEQKQCMTSIDNPISFTEVKRAINKLKKEKAPGLNGIPPKALKAMDNVSR